MSRRLQTIATAAVLWPALSFAQSIFIDSPAQGETVTGPTVTLRMSVTDFQLGTDGRIAVRIDGILVVETERLRVTLAVPPGTHEIEARLVDRRSRPIDASVPETVKFTMDELND